MRAAPIEPVQSGESLARNVAAAGRPTGLTIRSIETFTSGRDIGFVRIRTDDGSEGWGQMSAYDADISAQVLHRRIAPHVLGRDPAAFGAISDICIEANHKFPWSYVCRALAGVDTAIWDLLAKRAGTSVAALLGGLPRPLPVYGSSMRRDIGAAEEADRLRQLRGDCGFAAFKIRVGQENGHDQDAWPGRSETVVPAVRQAVGDAVALLADANGCYTPAKAIEVGRLLEAHGYGHFEEPCRFWELEWTAEVTRSLDIDVTGGEQDNDLAQWRRMVAMDAVDIVQPDLCYVGGLTRALRVAAIAAGAGKPCVPHSANLSWVTVFTLHMIAALPNAGAYVEFCIEDEPWWDGLYDPPLVVRDGKVAVPEGPGWGVGLREPWLEGARREASELS